MAGYLRLLKQRGGLFRHWYRTATSKSEALRHEIKSSPEDIAALLLDTENIDADQDMESTSPLGFSFSVWNGRETEDGGIALSVDCGSQHLQISNSIVLELPSVPEMVGEDDVRELFEEMIEYWSPDSAFVSSSAFNREHAERPIRPGAWMHYDSDPEGWPAEVAEAETRPMADGRVVELAESASEIGTPEHVRRYKQVLKQKPTP